MAPGGCGAISRRCGIGSVSGEAGFCRLMWRGSGRIHWDTNIAGAVARLL
ncbi:hypothetical protein GLE_2964 [Lysobacter enzymogenes]|uniref:Uncharacterized protein n=1 Tax=Lysobacter enzymogenes TaxID=69 RepID=A0A0S2DJ49_LYSEN|nr:hypothetical protein GLE_2964 [Lysobacter enzymogenes]